ncbi:hypothetical protein Tco_1318829 [Tanacetum coccineum]
MSPCRYLPVKFLSETDVSPNPLYSACLACPEYVRVSLEQQTAAMASVSILKEHYDLEEILLVVDPAFAGLKPFYARIWYQTPDRTSWKLSSGIPQSIEGNVTASKPQTLERSAAQLIAHRTIGPINKA